MLLSYDTIDRELVERIALCLRRIGIVALLADRSIEAGTEIPDNIAFHINDSNCFVAILTSSSLTSQWVNQEIGYAYAFRDSRNLLIVPVVESGHPFKIPLPSQDEINEAVAAGRVFLAPCVNPNCRNVSNLNPMTFDVI